MKISKTRKEQEDRKSWSKQLKRFWGKLSTKEKIRRGNSHNSWQAMALLGRKHHLEVHEKQTWRPLRRQKKPVLTAKQRTAHVKFAKPYYRRRGCFFFRTNVQNICFSCLIPKMMLLWFSGEPSASCIHGENSSKWIIWAEWQAVVSRGFILYLKDRLTADYYINNMLEKEVKPLLRRKNVNEAIDKRKLFSSNRHMTFVQNGGPLSTRSQGHPSRVQKKPAKFYRGNKLASKFARYQPCGESLEHNGWICLQRSNS